MRPYICPTCSDDTHGEIEAKIVEQHGVSDASVEVLERDGVKRLVAYYVGKLEVEAVKSMLATKIPENVMPAFFQKLDQMPLTTNGKVDRTKLPAPTINSAVSSSRFLIKPVGELEGQLLPLFKQILDIESLSTEDNFFEVGGTSLLAIKLIALINKELGIELTVAAFFGSPNIKKLATALSGKSAKRVKRTNQGQRGAVAVVAMAGRFPGAQDLDEYWQMICEKREGISFFSPDELDPSISFEMKSDPNYVAARGVVEGSELFDAAFFGYSPRVAELMDPQIRIMMELSHQALESSGTVPATYDGKIGIFAGMTNNSYYPNNVIHHPKRVNAIGEWTVSTFNEKDYITTHIAHKLNLNGPALSIHTACSTSLVAINQAVRSIQQGDCDMALAGGINIEARHNSGHIFQEGGIRTADGHCRPFDAKSSGTLFSDGAGVVVLKDLEQAKRDGNTIIALVKGVGVNNDGNDKVSFSAPSVNGQRDVVEMALEDAGVEAASIGLLEAHGTATPVGDPIEVEALTQAWSGAEKKEYCALGSVKGNIGHTVAAAGVAGFIKSVLALKNRVLPPTANFETNNPQIDFSKTPLYVNSEIKPWVGGSTPRRAAVSAFGVGGTNAHTILEEYRPSIQSSNETDLQLFPISANSESSLRKLLVKWSDFLSSNPDLDLKDASYTLLNGRKKYPVATFFVAESVSMLQEQIEQTLKKSVISKESSADSITFAFPGQGSQYLGMGEELYRRFPIFKQSMDRCAEVLNRHLDRDIRDLIFNDRSDNALKNTYYTQPAIFTFEYSLAVTLIELGVKPDSLIGHSIGEFVAATISGIIQLEDALQMIAKRGELMRTLPGGSMLSVRATAKEVSPLLNSAVQMAAINGPKLCVVAGPDDQIDQLSQTLEAKGIVSKRLHTSHAFHSAMMDSIVAPYHKFLTSFTLKQGELPILSTVSVDWNMEQMCDHKYWSSHLRKCVSYNPAAQKLAEQQGVLMVEVGPRNTLTTLTAQQARVQKSDILTVATTGAARGSEELRGFLSSLGALWSAGVKLSSTTLFADRGTMIALPTYAFESKRFWLESKAAQESLNSEIKISITDNSKTVVNERITMDSQANQVKSGIVSDLKEILADSSGLETSELGVDQTFMEMGLDSLLLTQVAQELNRKFECQITFRQLLGELDSIDALTTYFSQSASAAVLEGYRTQEQVQGQVLVQGHSQEEVQTQSLEQICPPIQNGPASVKPVVNQVVTNSVAPNGVSELIAAQLNLMAQQLQLLQGVPVAAAATVAPTQSVDQTTVTPAKVKVEQPKTSSVTPKQVKSARINELKADVNTADKAFGAQARISTVKSNESQKVLDGVIKEYVAKTQKSKDFTQKYRAINADPRVVTGFRPEIKEMVYPVVVNRSKGQHLWDIDGNEYVDMTCGFGSNFFGNQNPRITKALHDQLDSGIEIGPQHELVGECAELVCEFSQMDRAAFCNTGSEAVLGALRMARSITGRKTIVMFKGSYHGINDEVIVRGLNSGKAMPAAAGINRSSVQDIMVLDYGTDESLEIIRKSIDSIAAVICEPVQSRRADFRPVEFLKELREITTDSHSALIFDEVITGFRIAPGGVQEFFGIKADLATYGKIVGGGMPIGVIAGSKRFMDALDGGFWQYGDDSTPTVGVTYFAGTFVRHPLAMRALREALLILKEGGQELYDRINSTSDKFVEELNLFSQAVGAPIKINHFGGVLKPTMTDNGKNNDVFFTLMRKNGVHVYDGFPWFVTLGHTGEDLKFVINTFKASVVEMQELGLFPSHYVDSINRSVTGEVDFITPPVPGARLGKDEQGNPAWFVPDRESTNGFAKVVS
jgi:acyl transferase domain-containing protein